MTIRCPVCKADNTTGPICRRCKADLSLVFALEDQRDRLLSAARSALEGGRFADAYRLAHRADHLRHDGTSRHLVALSALLGRDFATAWRERRVLS